MGMGMRRARPSHPAGQPLPLNFQLSTFIPRRGCRLRGWKVDEERVESRWGWGCDEPAPRIQPVNLLPLNFQLSTFIPRRGCRLRGWKVDEERVESRWGWGCDEPAPRIQPVNLLPLNFQLSTFIPRRGCRLRDGKWMKRERESMGMGWGCEEQALTALFHFSTLYRLLSTHQFLLPARFSPWYHPDGVQL